MTLFKKIYAKKYLAALGIIIICLVGGAIWLSGSQEVSHSVNRVNEHGGQREGDTDVASASEANNNSSHQSGDDNNAQPAANQTSNKSQATNSDLRAAAVTTFAQISHALQSQDEEAFYQLLSSEIKGAFTQQAVDEAFAQAQNVKIINQGSVDINNQWATQTLVAQQENNQKLTYTVVLHFEDDQWKLYGTMPAD